MSRLRSAAEAALDRRSFLAATGAVGVSAGIGLALRPDTHARTVAAAGPPGAAPAAPAAPGASPAAPPRVPVPGWFPTTLRTVATPRGSASGYRRLGPGPGWKRVIRTQLAAARSGRAERRTALASFVQLTDLHLTDVQHPVRTEYLRAQAAGAWRPQEALTVHGAISLVERVNALRGGPVTGADLGFVMTTGDNTDNNCKAELDWFLRTMSGGRITPDTGDPARYEGVQDSGLPLYWHPDAALRDADKQRGFPRLEGYLAAARRPVTSPGLRLPWYSTVGNHDDLPSGCFANGNGSGYLAEFAVGGRKLLSLPVGEARALEAVLRKGTDPRGGYFTDLLRRETRRMRRVTPDASRAPFTPREYVEAHLDPAYAGAGPAGHGYTRENADTGNLHYSFRISDGVLGISLDTTDKGGHFAGSIGRAQLDWLKRTLLAHRDDHVIVFSHHNSWTFDDGGGEKLVALLKRNRNVVAWINGHSHRNEILAHGGFWEISTASHVEFPQLARIVELTDNHDGTLSLFTTLIESATPHRTDYDDLSQTGLAALYRELSLNAPGARQNLAGPPEARNTELLLKKR
ncbi:metallophosphoesterase [Streptomyces agglomeratus]|uniref:Metallophosphoesterase n=1 Tax=Streptomyces agglomeratus TaxID=285458 RepID=A0A1E5PBL7_9ACTN|nr:TIGR03767 family metallophosphoesterase [Streptomyces agglomeratus]OEJ26865.1 metallophosphoesterase [Streptomyces agglomeratus]OEJ39088.1 metallophosphoesterase [Streptomyces agglomeratus]OEJ46530.1 metallophosphoesterase [Streptomyces agglomeratus]OEJ51612.1 metallophosphoesterase [Streptomyces agglomeratus]